MNPLIDTFGNIKRWVNWQYQEVDGKQTKVPYSTSGYKASTTNEKTWSTYDEAIKISSNIGIIFTPDKKLLGIDIDHCIENGKVSSEIAAFLELANTYMEISPSGTGLHLYIILTEPFELKANKHAPFEIYLSGRYFTVTQKVWKKEKGVRAMSNIEVTSLLQSIGYPWGKEQKEVFSQDKPEVLDDSIIINKMFASKTGDKIARLYGGDISQYQNDDSSADMALCSHLAFWTGCNTSQMERIWLSSPLGQRSKTQKRKDYVDRTINNAIKGCSEVYKPNKPAIGKVEEKTKYVPAISHADFIKTEYPPAKYIIDFLIEKNAMNMVSAPPNGWKSWLLFLFAGNIANGTPVFNKFQTEKSNVMIVNEEDIPSLVQNRLKLLGFTDPSLPIYYRIAQGAKLTSEFVDSLILECKEKKIGVIMFDSLRAIHDADENSSKEMQVVLDLFKKINRENITVIFTHHHKKKNAHGKNEDAEMSRGSTAINASISGHISLEEIKKDEGKFLIIKHLKSKAGAKLDDFDIEIRITDHIFTFEYIGDHQPKEQALNEAKTGILYELENRKELLSRKDFLELEIAGATSIKDATNFLVKEGKIKVITRKIAEEAGHKSLSPGKANENLYLISKDDSDFDAFRQPCFDTS